MAFGTLSLKGRALRHLARREHSRAELERKLARHLEDTLEDPAAPRIAAVLDELATLGLLSDARAAQSVLSRAAPRHGLRRLRQTLQAKGLDAELVASTLGQARGSELERAREIWRRRYGAAPRDAAERARQMRFLAGRGFESEVIRRVVQGGDDDGEP